MGSNQALHSVAYSSKDGSHSLVLYIRRFAISHRDLPYAGHVHLYRSSKHQGIISTEPTLTVLRQTMLGLRESKHADCGQMDP